MGVGGGTKNESIRILRLYLFAEIEDQVKKILKLVRSKDNGITKESKRESELVGLINNFHDRYQSLYAHYNLLKGKSGVRKGKGMNYSPCSSSDSEYYSSEEIEINSSNLRNAHQEISVEQQGVALEVSELRNKLMSTSEEKAALNSEYQEALSKIQAAENMNKSLRDAADERQREISALVKVHEAHGNRASARIKELEGQVSSLKLELGSLNDQKRDLEAQFATEAKQLGEKNIELHAQVDSLLKQVKDNENNSTSRIEDLKSQVSHLQQEVYSLRAPKEQATEQVRGLVVQANVMQQDLVSLTSQKNELQLLLKGKTKEISEYLTQLKTLEEELKKKSEVEHKLLKEREDFLMRVKDLESLCNQKKKLEEEIDGKIEDARQSREENDRLLAKISQTENELSAFRRKIAVQENEASAQILALKAKVDNLQQKLDDMQTKKGQLDSQIAREKGECPESRTELEQRNIKLTNKIANQQKIMKNQEDKIADQQKIIKNLEDKIADQQVIMKNQEDKIADQQKIMKNQEDTVEKLTEESKQAKRQILGSKTSLQIAERKMTELAEDFRKRLEDNIRVLFRRIQVAEQLHNETKDSYKKTLEQLEESNRLLSSEGQSRKMRDMLEPGNKALLAMESVVKKLEINGDLANRLSKMSDDLASAKNWVTESNNSKKSLQQQVKSLVQKLDRMEEQESFLREEISNFEAKLGKQGGDKLNIIKTMSELEKKVGELEKRIKEQDAELLTLGELENKIKQQDAELLSLGEEKREAIRQLCVFIDHQRTDCDYLKAEIAKCARTSKTNT
ncbi:COP1-interactive protein 1-like [Citrus sinensis]|uniref:COP1-interactive protein 1-like n=1 Tax=Citrus sinensis TaxID=2711 RepID=UPI00227809C8|nr:COP1-interactive protein 1-like [Citrus sinensis]